MPDLPSNAQPGCDMIAVVGMAGRFPGAQTLEQFWCNLRNGVESISFLTDEELKAAGVDPDSLASPKYVRATSYLEDLDKFDAAFFGYGPREAELMDPQHRIFLECAWAALEDAGCEAASYDGSIGVYAGGGLNSYYTSNIAGHPELMAQGEEYEALFGNEKDFLATRVAYKLDLKGPSLCVQTACSSSLVAVHLACQALLTRECDAALAGGISLSHAARVGYLHRDGMILSADGHCRAFDAKASGTVTGRGAGVVLLKRLSDALSEGDSVRAIIRGTAINNDGTRKVSFAAPSVSGQTRVIREALENADVEPETITYVEAHGTATALGDPAEIAALTEAFRTGTDRSGFCALGSVKTNFGHLDAAAGIAGLIKTILALQHRQIPPSLHFETANPAIDFARTPFYVNTHLLEWKCRDHPRRAGVSSFGIGGTNAHVILEEAPVQPNPTRSRRPQLLVLSARSSAALESASANLLKFLQANPTIEIADVAYTLQVGRKAFNHRRFLVCENTEHAIQKLESRKGVVSSPEEQTERSLVFLLGGSRPALATARQLYEVEATFQQKFDECAEQLRPRLGWDLRTGFCSQKGLDSTGHCLEKAPAALFAVDYALAQLWMSWGIRPQAVVARGVGEYVAAAIAGVCSVEEALEFVAAECLGQGSDKTEVGAQAKLLMERLKKASLKPATIPILLRSAGTWLATGQTMNAAFLTPCDQAPLEFVARLEELLKETGRVFLEIGSSALCAEGLARHGAEPVVLPAVDSGEDKRLNLASLLDSLGRLWLLGFPVDWHAFHAPEPRRRIPLPTYPFERKRFWVEKPKPADLAQPSPIAEKENLDNWFYVPSWKRGAPLAVATSVLPQQRSMWLIFSDQTGVMSEFMIGLHNAGARVVQVEVGQEFKAISHSHFVLNPDSAADYQRLIYELVSADNLPDHIVHAWTVTPLPPGDHVSCFDAVQNLGFYSLLFLSQALNKSVVYRPIQLDVVSSNLHEVIGDEIVCPEKATILGPCRVIPQEFPNFRCRHIDIQLKPGEAPAALVSQLQAEILANAGHQDRIVAYRGRNRWIQTFEKARYGGAADQLPLRQGGVYLITGGLGRVGLAIAEFLANKVQAKLILTSRTALPARKDWELWLSDHPAEDPTSSKIRRILELEKSGAEVLPVAVDVADKPAMEAALAQASRRFGPLHGVIHAAGILTGAAIRNASREECELQFRPKIHGLFCLQKLLAEKQLDFCALTSSVASVLGGLGSVAYSAANLFMDYFTLQHNRTASTPWISIGWDMWNVAANLPQSGFAADSATLSMSTAQATEALQRILSSRSPVSPVVISTTNLQGRLDRWIASASASPPHAMSERPARHERGNLSVPYLAPRDDLERTVAAIWSTALGFDKIGVHDDFFELGGYSLLATRIMTRLRETFQCDLGLHALLSAPTVAELCRTIRAHESSPGQSEEIARLIQTVEQMSAEEVREVLEAGKPWQGGSL